MNIIIEKIKEIFNKMFHKTKKGIAIGTIATVGLAAACAADKKTDMLDNNVKMEQENSKQKNDYKKSLEIPIPVYQGGLEELIQKHREMQNNKMPNNEKRLVEYLIRYLYIKQYEKITGDTDYTMSDIEFDYDYVQNLYTYKVEPEQENIPCIEEHNVKVYQVKDTEGKVIDCVRLQSEDGEIVPVQVDMDGSIDNSVLVTMGTVIPNGIDYIECIDKGNETDIENSRKKYMESVEKFDIEKLERECLNATEEKTDENPEEGFEHE